MEAAELQTWSTAVAVGVVPELAVRCAKDQSAGIQELVASGPVDSVDTSSDGF